MKQVKYSRNESPCMVYIGARRLRSASPMRMSSTDEPVNAACKSGRVSYICFSSLDQLAYLVHLVDEEVRTAVADKLVRLLHQAFA